MSIINKIPEQLKDFYRKIFKRSDFGHFHSIALAVDLIRCILVITIIFFTDNLAQIQRLIGILSKIACAYIF